MNIVQGIDRGVNCETAMVALLLARCSCSIPQHMSAGIRGKLKTGWAETRPVL